MLEWLALSRRSFMSSYGRTSDTIVAPVRSHSGRPWGKRSSITHWVNGSAITGQASCMPSIAAIRARSASVVAGTIRSTMLSGQASSVCTQAPNSGSRRCAKRVRTRWVVRPLAGRLSQDSTVNGSVPAARRARRAAARKPGAVRGRSGSARSARIAGSVSSSSPVAGFQQ